MPKRARGFNPDPPELTEAAGDWKPNELFWITRNGVRMSGMPAWSVTHSDKEIWEIVAFAQKLPKMTAAQYKELSRQAPPMREP
jgi:mono/diheme cytochrome c family protein